MQIARVKVACAVNHVWLVGKSNEDSSVVPVCTLKNSSADFLIRWCSVPVNESKISVDLLNIVCVTEELESQPN